MKKIIIICALFISLHAHAMSRQIALLKTLTTSATSLFVKRTVNTYNNTSLQQIILKRKDALVDNGISKRLLSYKTEPNKVDALKSEVKQPTYWKGFLLSGIGITLLSSNEDNKNNRKEIIETFIEQTNGTTFIGYPTSVTVINGYGKELCSLSFDGAKTQKYTFDANEDDTLISIWSVDAHQVKIWSTVEQRVVCIVDWQNPEKGQTITITSFITPEVKVVKSLHHSDAIEKAQDEVRFDRLWEVKVENDRVHLRWGLENKQNPRMLAYMDVIFSAQSQKGFTLGACHYNPYCTFFLGEVKDRYSFPQSNLLRNAQKFNLHGTLVDNKLCYSVTENKDNYKEVGKVLTNEYYLLGSSIDGVTDGKYICANSSVGINVWNVATGKLERILPFTAPWGLCMLENNALLAIDQRSGQISLWDVNSGKNLGFYYNPEGRIAKWLAWPTGLVKTISEDGSVRTITAQTVQSNY